MRRNKLNLNRYMNKKLLFIPVLGILWSCSKQKELKPIASEDQNPGKKLEVKSARDGQWDLLGFGYDVTGEYANSNSTTFPVIDIAKLNTVEPTRIITNLNTTRNSLSAYGESAQAYSYDISTKLKATAGFSLFKGELTAAYSSSNSFNSKFIYGSYSIIIQQKEIKFNATPLLLQSYLTPTFAHDITVLSAQQIVDQYGAFVLTDVILGAKLEITYQSETTSSDRKSAASAGLDASVGSVFSTNINVNTNHTQSSSNFNQYLHYVTHGGDPTKGLVNTIELNSNTPKVDFTDWQNSTNFQNAELVDINSSGLVPIYQLIADVNKAAAVKTYVDQYLKAHQVHTALPEGQFTRNDDTGEVFIVMDGKLRYIPNQDVLYGLFEFKESMMVHYNNTSLANFEMGVAISPDNGIINNTQNGKVYFREKSLIRYIPTIHEKEIYHFNFKNLRNVNGIAPYTVGPDI